MKTKFMKTLLVLTLFFAFPLNAIEDDETENDYIPQSVFMKQLIPLREAYEQDPATFLTAVHFILDGVETVARPYLPSSAINFMDIVRLGVLMHANFWNIDSFYTTASPLKKILGALLFGHTALDVLTYFSYYDPNLSLWGRTFAPLAAFGCGFGYMFFKLYEFQENSSSNNELEHSTYGDY
ncbi:hypothetical protein Bealeia1_01705 [Candidatus Bealeia paramacronuclearis]|uniref:Uncharacterized protein n=1 Tax=Candidatus Bealeia paramacronuclearis TaxID=1921001 RepID=A0ABZ2C5V4_9PROT|nr:hypothetical protein [Candidatus Bealeia paramacronuclearis]